MRHSPTGNTTSLSVSESQVGAGVTRYAELFHFARGKASKNDGTMTSLLAHTQIQSYNKIQKYGKKSDSLVFKSQ